MGPQISKPNGLGRDHTLKTHNVETAITSETTRFVPMRCTNRSRISLTIGESVRDEDVFVCHYQGFYIV